MAYALAPLLTEKDEAQSSEGGLDPLGLYPLADAVAVRLVPGVRERQLHPRFLTAIAVSLAICSESDDEVLAADDVSEAWLVFEWYLVEGLVRTCQAEETVGLPGSQKARKAVSEHVPLSAKRYLKSPAAFGFHAVYRPLARALGIEESGRLGETGYELVSAWAKEQGLEGFIGTLPGPGQACRRQLIDAVRAGLEKASTARSGSWSGWQFFREHLALYDIGPREARVISNALLDDGAGCRREVMEFLVSPEGKQFWAEERSEAKFHEALSRRASDGLRALLDAIERYETFPRLVQDAFDDCLCEMTRRPGKVPPEELSHLDSVKLAALRVPEVSGGVMECLEAFGESFRFSESFSRLCERTNTREWLAQLVEHHLKTQRLKAPDGKNPWFERYDDGSLILRPLYRRDEPGTHDGSYVHAYRTGSLWSFAEDLQLVSP